MKSPSRYTSSLFVSWMLGAYFIIQVVTLFLHWRIAFVAYEIFYLIALIVALARIVTRTRMDENLSATGRLILLFLGVNLALFALYFIMLFSGAGPAWETSGEIHSKPLEILLYVPVIHFAVAFVLLGLTGLITRMATEKKASPGDSV